MFCECVYTGAVRTAFLIIVLVLLFFYAIGSALPGCEDVLEVCQPCGSIADGDITISGDPRIDGTFEAFHRIRHRVDQITANYEAGTAELIRVFGLASMNIAALEEEVARSFLSESVVDVVFDLRPAVCFVDWHLETKAQNSCERRLCSIRIANDEAWCRGYLVGPCDTPRERTCFEVAAGPCDGSCIGVCRDMTDGVCPGLCAGTCQGDCSAYNSAGVCYGRCLGVCSGICESASPFSCNGTCNGVCEADDPDAGCADD